MNLMKSFVKQRKKEKKLKGNYSKGSNHWKPCQRFSSPPNSTEIVNFWGEHFPPFLHADYLEKNISSNIFHNNLNMCFVYTFPMEHEFTIYYLSPDPFSYIVSAYFLQAWNMEYARVWRSLHE